MPIATHIETPLIKVSPLNSLLDNICGIEVPFESLKKAAKERKTVVDEATRALSGISSMTANPELTQEEAASQLGSLVEKLTSLKRKATNPLTLIFPFLSTTVGRSIDKRRDRSIEVAGQTEVSGRSRRTWRRRIG